MRRLGLGTVQFGMDYGVSNQGGKVSESEVEQVLQLARQQGISILDTASAYGDSEAVIGRALRGCRDLPIVTKTTPFGTGDITPSVLDTISSQFQSSLERLQTQAVYGLLIHHGEVLLRRGGDLLYARLEQWKREGLVRKIGVSVYGGAQALRLADSFTLALIQLPLNVFDQGALADGTLGSLKLRGVEIHARSIFLQGLLLMGDEELPASLQRFAPRLREYRIYLSEAGYSPLEVAIGFIKRVPQIDIALIGVTSTAQLRECVTAYDRGCDDLELARFASDDVHLIDPRRWSRQ